MALDSKNNIKSVFIIPDQAAVLSGTITPGSVLKDSVVITNMSNQVLVAGSAPGIGVLNYDKIKIIKDRGDGMPLQQVVLTLPSITSYTGAAGEVAREQVSFIGNNGTTGTITGQTGSLENNFFIVKLEHTPNSFIYGKRPASYKYGTYQSSASADQQEVATGLVKSLIANFRPNRTTDWRVFTEIVNNVARSGAGAGTGTLTFTKYSKIVTASALAATGSLAVGDYVSSAEGTDVGLYKVTAIDGTSGNLTLNISYQGNTISVNAADDIATDGIPGAAGDFGIKITGIKQKYDVNRWRQYDKVRFNVYLEGFGYATVAENNAAFDGVAVYEQVANDEYISWGDEGQIFVDQVPPLFREQDAVSGQQYIPLVLSWLDRLPSLIGAGENKGQAILYFEDVTTGGNQGLALIAVLNSWLTGRFPGATFPALPTP
jgi:hypothetical protein